MTKPSTEHRTSRRFTSGGFLWGPRRVSLGMSLRELEDATGIYRAFLSRMENGVMIPSGEEFDRVMRVIEERETSARVPPARPEPVGQASMA